MPKKPYKPIPKLPIDTCDRCGSGSGPLQIVFKSIGFEALCLECKKQYMNQQKNTDKKKA